MEPPEPGLSQMIGESVCGGNIIKSNIALMQCRIFKIDTGLKTKLEWWRSVNMPWKWQPYSILGHLPRVINSISQLINTGVSLGSV